VGAASGARRPRVGWHSLPRAAYVGPVRVPAAAREGDDGQAWRPHRCPRCSADPALQTRRKDAGGWRRGRGRVCLVWWDQTRGGHSRCRTRPRSAPSPLFLLFFFAPIFLLVARPPTHHAPSSPQPTTPTPHCGVTPPAARPAAVRAAIGATSACGRPSAPHKPGVQAQARGPPTLHARPVAHQNGHRSEHRVDVPYSPRRHSRPVCTSHPAAVDARPSTPAVKEPEGEAPPSRPLAAGRQPCRCQPTAERSHHHVPTRNTPHARTGAMQSTPAHTPTQTRTQTRKNTMQTRRETKRRTEKTRKARQSCGLIPPHIACSRQNLGTPTSTETGQASTARHQPPIHHPHHSGTTSCTRQARKSGNR